MKSIESLPFCNDKYPAMLNGRCYTRSMFSENLKAARKQEGISQADLADLVHVSRQAVTKWESGENEPSLEMITSLSAALHVDVSYLLNGEKTSQGTKPALTYGVLARLFGLLLATVAVFLLFLPGVAFTSSGIENMAGNPWGYSFVFGSSGLLLNPLALLGWLTLIIGFSALVIDFFLPEGSPKKKIFWWIAVALFVAAAILFLSCQVLNPRSLAGPSRGLADEGIEGIGPSFVASDLDDATIAYAKSQGVEITRDSGTFIQWKTALLSLYSLVGDTFYYNQSSGYCLAISSRDSNLGPAFWSSAACCLAAGDTLVVGFFFRQRRVHVA